MKKGFRFLCMAVLFSALVSAFMNNAPAQNRGAGERERPPGGPVPIAEPMPGMNPPPIEFISNTLQVKKGEQVVLQWNATGVGEVFLWKSTDRPTAPEPIDWWEISRMGERANPAGDIRMNQNETTAYFLVAKTPLAASGQRIIVEVVSERKAARSLPACNPTAEIIQKMEQPAGEERLRQSNRPAKNLDQLQTDLAKIKPKWWLCSPTPPVVGFSADHDVIFEDETSVLTWSITNASYADGGYTTSQTKLAADLGSVSGTKMTSTGWGAGGYPKYGYPMSGSWTIDGKTQKAKLIWAHATATGTTGLTASGSQFVDILSVPQFKGSYTTARIAFIRSHIKKIVQNLRGGCIYNDATLDGTVDAFKSGYLNRGDVWARLLAELQNAQLITFNIKELTGTGTSIQNAAMASWGNYTNEIILRWKVDLLNEPSEYAVLHELVHKCGFNMDLYKYNYTKDQIEDQTDKVASSCYP